MDIFERIENLLIERYKDWDGKEQFGGSGDRLKRMVEEMCWPQKKVEEELGKCFKAVWKENYSEMLTEGPISVDTFCPHHLLPCNFKVYIGYVPNLKILGLSKFSRVSEIIGKRPIIQERYTSELAKVLFGSLEPLGVGVHVVGKHGCMRCRGVKQEADVKTSVLLGCFLDDPSVKEEFYRNIGG